MTMPDRIQITHQPRTMTTPTISAVLERLVELDKRIEDVIPGIEIDNWIDAMDAARAALKAEPRRKGPTDEDLYDLAAEFNGDPVPAMRRALELWGNPLQGHPAPGENPAAAPAPVPETPAEALAARPLLERVAQLGDVIGRQTVAQVRQLANQAAVWLRENPPGQPVAIEPRACPTPGACSCVEPTPPAPVAELDDRQREAVHQAVAEALGSGAYDCTRVWSAWSCGTMGSDDFVPVAEDSDRVAEIADAAIEAIRAIPLPAPVPVAVSERRPEGNWVDSLQHAVESKENDFLAGVCVSLAVVTAHGEATVWREIVRSVGTENLLNYAANVNPDDWNLAGFSEYAQAELGKGKPDPAPQAGEVEA